MPASKVGARRRGTPPEQGGTGKFPLVKPEGADPLVLLVDDSEDDREMYAAAFADCGFRVEHAVDGEHALFKVWSIQPDLIIMDIAMPILDGVEATRALKTHPRAQHIPVVVLTAHATPENLQHARDAGADVVLTKPCAPEDLLSVVDRILPR